ncbi:MAG TPA: LysM peptidoglycan-binding domain-containing protein, partial [Firmicutes bacterium]|nr:LysM peptidoglycan-binding domain-containing protein [Bacillota bacterium]
MRATRAWVVALAAGLWLAGGGAAGASSFETIQDYVVQRGDTLYSLARRSGTTVAELCRLNGIGPDYLIRVGQRLRLPGAGAAAAAVEGTGGGSYAMVLPAER